MGDIMIVGLSTNLGACGYDSGADQVSFFCTKPLVPGTVIDLTDNGFARAYPELWGTNEGFLRVTRTGASIPAGQVITWHLRNVGGSANLTPIMPTEGWEVVTLNGISSVNFGSDGDQLFFLQGGDWDGSIAQAGSYTGGRLLYVFNSGGTWSDLAGTNHQSGLPAALTCASHTTASIQNHLHYNGPMGPATPDTWMLRTSDPQNWLVFANCMDHQAAVDWTNAPLLPILPAHAPGTWVGAWDNDWFNCGNWSDLCVPNAQSTVIFGPEAQLPCVVAYPNAQDASSAHCGTLIVDGPLPYPLHVQLPETYVSELLELRMGTIKVEAAGLLSIGPAGSIIGGDHDSHVQGPVRRFGAQDLLFPVGDADTLAAVRLTHLQNADDATAFTVRYHRMGPTDLEALDPELHHLSTCEHWCIEQAVGSPRAQIGLAWDNTISCGVEMPLDLRVARWNGTLWEDKGNSSIADGFVTSNDIESAFSFWTLASATPANPLPVQWLHVDVTADHHAAHVRWSTGNEHNGAFFTVERGSAPDMLVALGGVQAAGHSNLVQHYAWTDLTPLPGTGYYRITRTDPDGSRSSSATVPLHWRGDPKRTAMIVAGAVITLQRSIVSPSTYSLHDMKGRTVLSGILELGHEHHLNVSGLARALYALRVDAQLAGLYLLE